MISQQNCNLQQAMSHTTPAPQRFTHPTPFPLPPPPSCPVARSFSLLSTLSLLPSDPSPHVLSISPALIISLSIYLSIAVSSSLRVSSSSSFATDRLAPSNRPCLTVGAPAHHLQTFAYLRFKRPPFFQPLPLPPPSPPPFLLLPLLAIVLPLARFLSLFFANGLSLSLSLLAVADASTRSFSRSYHHPSPRSRHAPFRVLAFSKTSLPAVSVRAYPNLAPRFADAPFLSPRFLFRRVVIYPFNSTLAE